MILLVFLLLMAGTLVKIFQTWFTICEIPNGKKSIWNANFIFKILNFKSDQFQSRLGTAYVDIQHFDIYFVSCYLSL